MIGHVRKLAFGDAQRFISGQGFWARRPGYTWKARMCDLIILMRTKLMQKHPYHATLYN